LEPDPLDSTLNRRQFLAASGAIALTASPIRGVLSDDEEDSRSRATGELTVKRLSWAGIQLTAGATTLCVDPVITPSALGAQWKDPVVPIEVPTDRRYVLVTHLHNDHFDPPTVAKIIEKSGLVGCHHEHGEYLASRGVKVRALGTYEPYILGDFTVCPVLAVDAFNDFQISWVISGGGKRVIHCGDTLWHGNWWRVGRLYGPFDAAFLPINGANILEHETPSLLPATMTPEQAVAAAVILGAKLIVPIHYGYNEPGVYEEYPRAHEILLETARKRGVGVETLKGGEWMNWKSNRDA